MLCELQKHIVRSFGHHQGEAIKPMAIIQKLKCKFTMFKVVTGCLVCHVYVVVVFLTLFSILLVQLYMFVLILILM